MSKHWFFWFRIKDQDLTSSPGTFLHGNSLFLAGSEPHNFSHSSAFPPVPGHTTSPNVHCDAALLCRRLQQADHHTNFFTCLNWYSSPEKLADFFYSSVWNVPWDCWRSSVSAPSDPSNWIHPWVQLRSQMHMCRFTHCNYPLLCCSFTPIFLLNKADLGR